METKTVVRVLALVCVLVGCGGDEQLEALAPGEFVDVDGEPVEPETDSGAELVQPDAGAQVAVLADAGAPPAPTPGSDAAVDLPAVVDAGAPSVPVTPPCFVELHRDADGDGFGEAAVTRVLCSATAGFVADATDCFDGNALASPAAKPVVMFDVDRGDGSFDYDCDGVETPRIAAVAACPTFLPADVHCPPPGLRLPHVEGDEWNLSACYDSLRERVDPVREGWYQTLAPCGAVALYGVTISYSRETSYTCSAPAAQQLQLQTCR